MNRKLLFFCAATLPFFLFLVVLQSVQYQDQEKKVRVKELAQYEWVEKNKKAMAGITVLTAPDRIESLAKNQLRLEPISTEKIIKVKFPISEH